MCSAIEPVRVRNADDAGAESTAVPARVPLELVSLAMEGSLGSCYLSFL